MLDLPYFAISQSGEGHRARGVECQDFSVGLSPIAAPSLGRTFVVMAIADGVGSADFSATGSKVAAEAFAEHVSRKIRSVSAEDEVELIVRDAFKEAMTAVEERAEVDKVPLPLFDTTLTGVAYDGSCAWIGHAGDDGVVAMNADGKCLMVTARHEGSGPSSVKPLRNRSSWQFLRVPNVAALAMMTDGILDLCVPPARKNKVNVAYLRSLLCQPIVGDKAKRSVKAAWEGWLEGDGAPEGGRLRDWVSDDLTVAFVQNPDAVAALPPYSFDREAFDRETKCLYDEREQELWRLQQQYLPDGHAAAESVPDWVASTWEPPLVQPLMWSPPAPEPPMPQQDALQNNAMQGMTSPCRQESRAVARVEAVCLEPGGDATRASARAEASQGGRSQPDGRHGVFGGRGALPLALVFAAIALVVVTILWMVLSSGDKGGSAEMGDERVSMSESVEPQGEQMGSPEPVESPQNGLTGHDAYKEYDDPSARQEEGDATQACGSQPDDPYQCPENQFSSYGDDLFRSDAPLVAYERTSDGQGGAS